MFIIRNNSGTLDVVLSRKQIERYPTRSLAFAQNPKLMKKGPDEVSYVTNLYGVGDKDEYYNG